MTDAERKIREAGLQNSIVHTWLTSQRINDLTWVETLEFMALSLLQSSEYYRAELLKAHQNSPIPNKTLDTL